MVPGIDGEDSVQGLFSGRHLAQKALGCRQVEQELDLVGFRGHGPLIVGLREFVLIQLSQQHADLVVLMRRESGFVQDL